MANQTTREEVAAKSRRKFRCTTDFKQVHPIVENVVDRQFELRGTNQTWSADITYIPTQEGWQ